MASKGHSTVLDDDLLRLRLLLAVFLAMLVFLGVYLWRIQVSSGGRYEGDLAKQSVRRIRIPGVRGAMIDRHGTVLADNRPSYNIALFLEELRKPGPWKNTMGHVQEILGQLSAIMGTTPVVGRDEVWNHIRRRLPLPLIAWRDISEPQLARFVEAGSNIPGVDIYVEPVRIYPQRSLACHALGYVGRADPDQDAEPENFHYYLPEMAGRAGLEQSQDAWLRGESGGRLMRVDVSGYRSRDLSTKYPQRGHDLMLSLDAGIQAVVETALAGQIGSAVVVDPNNGDILAIASTPGYDINQFIPAIPATAWRTLLEDVNKPLLNRAVAGTYPPGSTFKMITAFAGLENRKATLTETHNCPGYYKLGNATFRCWLRSGHGPVNLEQAIEGSCNIFFFHVGRQSGIDAIYHMASAMGLGEKTGVELHAEQAGLVANPAWKRKTMNDAWRDGDTCNISIGQGALLVTPLQMAMMTSTIANGGTLYRPRLVIARRSPGVEAYQRLEPVIHNQLNWGRENLKMVQLGMKDVVMSPSGTARMARVPGVVIAGKTGTAEFGRKDEKRRHAWMVSFAPFDAPKYAIALLVDEGVSGGETAAPVMKKILQGIFPGSSGGAG